MIYKFPGMFHRNVYLQTLGKILQVSCLMTFLAFIFIAGEGVAAPLATPVYGQQGGVPAQADPYYKRRGFHQRPPAVAPPSLAPPPAAKAMPAREVSNIAALAPAARSEPLPLLDPVLVPPPMRPRERPIQSTPSGFLRSRPGSAMPPVMGHVEMPAASVSAPNWQAAPAVVAEPLSVLPSASSRARMAVPEPAPLAYAPPLPEPMPLVAEMPAPLEVAMPPVVPEAFVAEPAPPALPQEEIAGLPVAASASGKGTDVNYFTPDSTAPSESSTEVINDESQAILNALPYDALPREVTVHSEVPGPGDFSMKRATDPAPIPTTAQAAVQDRGDSTMDIRVSPQSIDLNYELEKAYNALLSGDTDGAIRIYEEVLSIDPNEKTALFGLATTYHRIGLLDQARPVYGHLLKIDPYNVEALNNFFALVGAEAPHAAIEQLELLAMDNPDFAPIQAQIALLYQKLKNYPKAIQYMIRASTITPDNLAYKYNLAILYDQKGDVQRATTLYRYLLKIYKDGQELPASPKAIQERLTFLASN